MDDFPPNFKDKFFSIGYDVPRAEYYVNISTTPGSVGISIGFRAQSFGNQNRLTIFPDKQAFTWAIFSEGKPINRPAPYAVSRVIRKGNEVNRLRVVEKGDNITLSVNGERIWQGKDPAYKWRTGKITLGVYVTRGNAGEARFSNLVVRSVS